MSATRKRGILFAAITLIASVLMISVPPIFADEFPTYSVYDKPLLPKVKPSFTLKLAYLDPPNPFQANEHSMAIVFKNNVERMTGGDVEVMSYPSGSLGKERQLIELSRTGTIQAFIIAEGAVPIFYKKIQVLAIPFVFKDHSIAYRVLDGPFGKELTEDCAKDSGFRIVSFAENGGFRNFTNNKRSIRTPADMKGIKFRTMEHPGHMAIVNSLGGVATPIPWAELYTSLQTGVIDGQENPIPVINFGKLYEVQKYLTLDGHVYSLDFMFLNEQWFKSLPKKYQDVIRLAGYQAAVAARGINRILEWENLAKFEKNKVFDEIIVLSPEAKAKFAEIAQPAFMEWYKKEVDPKGIWSEKLLKAVKAAEADFGL